MPKQTKSSLAFASLPLTAAIAALALATAGHAQPPPPRPMPPGAAPPPRAAMPNRDAMRGQMQQRMADRRAERDRDLATVLRLRPDQMPALQAFVASQTPQRPMGPPPGAGGAMTTPQRLDRQAQRSRDRDAFRQRREQGLRTFYAALAPDQQQVFDALTRLRDSDGRRFGGRHGMRAMHGGPGRR